MIYQRSKKQTPVKQMPPKRMWTKQIITLLARVKCLMSHITNVGARQR